MKIPHQNTGGSAPSVETVSVSSEPYDLDDPGLLFRPDVLDDPVRLHRQLLEQAPVWEIPGTATFVVASERLVSEAASRTEDFSSNLTSLLYRGEDGRPRTFDMAPLGDPFHVLATADPPHHLIHRKLLQPRLTPARVALMESEMQSICDDLLEPYVAAGGGDLMSALADPFPARIIARVIGLPMEDAVELVALVLETNEILSGVVNADQMKRAVRAAAETHDYLSRHLRAALSKPDDGTTLLAAIAGAVNDETITVDQGLGMLIQLVAAGTETTTSLIGIAARHLGTHDSLQKRLRNDTSAIPLFVEEMLRIEAPFRFNYRTATRDTTLGDVAIPARSRVLLMWAAANLDVSGREDPLRVSVEHERPTSHFAFGRGLHFCVGAPLGRVEARVAMERLLGHERGFRLDPAGPPRLRPSIFIRRFERLPLIAH